MPTTERSRPARSPGTSTSCTKATFIRDSGDRGQERLVHDSDLRARLQRQHALSDHLNRDRLLGPDRHQSVTIWPTKVNLSFDTSPTGMTLYLDGIAKSTPFVYDTLVGFTHTIEGRNQTLGSTTYTFSSWSDGGAQMHSIVGARRTRVTSRRSRSTAVARHRALPPHTRSTKVLVLRPRTPRVTAA